MIGIGVIGCGLIGKKRALSLPSTFRLLACADTDITKAISIAPPNIPVFSNWEEVLHIPGIDAVIIATRHDSLAQITSSAIRAGKHVFVEKPVARFPEELAPLLKLAEEANVRVRVGFNHRFHPAMQKAKTLIESNVLGELMFLRARYGHGGRIGYDQEWRSNPNISGGGELIDQGSHLIDLSRWLLNEEFSVTHSAAHTYFWEMPVEDNAFLILTSERNKVAFLHASCTEWKNTFSLEIYGRHGKLEIQGLGGSYGLERLICYKMLPEMGPPDTMIWEYPRGDNSWAVELDAFYEDIVNHRAPEPGLLDALQALKIVNSVYLENGYDYRS